MADGAKLVEAAMRLRTAMPNEWDMFIAAMRNYAAATTAEILKADPSTLLRVQGRAQMAHEISSMLANAPTLSEQLRDRLEREKLRGGRSTSQFANGF